MKYIACLRVGQNDVNAIINIEGERRANFSPLLDMRGKDDKYLKTFLESWTQSPFFLDVSRVAADAKDTYIVNKDLHNPENAFSTKKKFFADAFEANRGLVPVVSWRDTDEQRQVVQFAMQLNTTYEKIAIRVSANSKPSAASLARLHAILDSVQRPETTTVIFDYGSTRPEDLSAGSEFHKMMLTIDAYGLEGICLLSTSYPADKPPSNTSRIVQCSDPEWQANAQMLGLKTKIIYGDFGATNPTAPMEFIQGMVILPFANYYIAPEWWQRRKGGDREFPNYIEIAKEIRQLPGYHNDDYCWANREIFRISKLPADAGAGYGSNGLWNGIKTNQHICVVIDQVSSVAKELDDYDDFI
ncbi:MULTISPECIES: beta family protein [Pseudomonas]|uniref:beta family protein n=1 Tax=Pseudomonas TaxID=286 RepID=UPI0030034813